MAEGNPILVTGAAGRIGGVGGTVVELLLRRDLPVRALVRRDDERADALRASGAEVVVGDLTRTEDVARALVGCRRMYFGMSVSPAYLEASVTAAAVAREHGDLEVFVNISQMTVSQMSLTSMTDSLQQRLHWLAEQVLNWSGLPVVHVRATVFLQTFFFLDWAAESIAKNGTIRLPFGNGRTSPVDAHDVAEVIATISGKSIVARRQGLRIDRAPVSGYPRPGGGVFRRARPARHGRGSPHRPVARHRSCEPPVARPCRQALAGDGAPSCGQSLRSTHARRRGHPGRPATPVRDFVAEHAQRFG